MKSGEAETRAARQEEEAGAVLTGKIAEEVSTVYASVDPTGGIDSASVLMQTSRATAMVKAALLGSGCS